MAKRKEDRYNNVEELLTDLEAVRDGLPPIRAHKRFDVSVLGQLEKGAPLKTEEKHFEEDILAIAHYKIATLVLGAVAAILLLVIVFLMLR